MKAIAILSHDRSQNLPALASAHEQGLTNFDASTWFAIFFPKGTPIAIVKKLNDAIVATMETRAVQDRLKEIGLTIVEPNRRSSEYLQKFVESEIAKWAVPIRSSGVSLD